MAAEQVKGLFVALQALNDSKLDVSCVSSYFSTGELFSCEYIPETASALTLLLIFI